MAKFAINESGAMLLLNLIQVTESISGSVVPLAMFFYNIKNDNDQSFNSGAVGGGVPPRFSLLTLGAFQCIPLQ